MNYGEALKDSSTVIGRAAVQQAEDRKVRMANAMKIAEETGRDVVEVLTEMYSSEIKSERARIFG